MTISFVEFSRRWRKKSLDILRICVYCSGVKVSAIKCPSCGDLVYSRARHDFRSCSCSEVAIDGGFDYTKICFRNLFPERINLDLDLSYTELFEDWSQAINQYGLIKTSL